MWTHWGLNPGPSACEADVIPLHHVPLLTSEPKKNAETRDRTGDLQIFSLTLSQLSYRGLPMTKQK